MRLYGDEAIKWCERTGAGPSKWSMRNGRSREYHPTDVTFAKEWLETVRICADGEYLASLNNDPSRAIMVDIPDAPFTGGERVRYVGTRAAFEGAEGVVRYPGPRLVDGFPVTIEYNRPGARMRSLHVPPDQYESARKEWATEVRWPRLSTAIQSHSIALLDVSARARRTVAGQATGEDRDRHIAAAKACEAAVGWLRGDGEERDAWGRTETDRVLVDTIKVTLQERDAANARAEDLEHRLDSALTERDLAESALVKIATMLNLEKEGEWECVVRAVAKVVDERSRIAELGVDVHDAAVAERDQAQESLRTALATVKRAYAALTEIRRIASRLDERAADDSYRRICNLAEEGLGKAETKVAPDTDRDTKALILHELWSSGDVGLFFEEFQERIKRPVLGALVQLETEGRIRKTHHKTYALTAAERDVQRLATEGARFMKERDEAERKLRRSTPIG